MNTAKLKVTAGCRDLLGVQKHANQHRLSRLVMEVHNDELRIIAAAVESYTDELIAALEAAEKRVAELENDEVRQRLANAEYQLYIAKLAKNNLRASRKAQFKKRLVAERRNAELTDALRQAVSGYKSCLRTGHDRIIELGGACDEPEVMIAGNPDIRQAEKILAGGE